MHKKVLVDKILWRLPETQKCGAGRGATFRVRLPLAPVRAAVGRPPAIQTDAALKNVYEDANLQLNGVRVLIIDDDADARILTKRVLSGLAAEPEIADGWDQALGILERFEPHVLISDLGMPTHDGFQLNRQVPARGYSDQRLPAIATLTGRTG